MGEFEKRINKMLEASNYGNFSVEYQENRLREILEEAKKEFPVDLIEGVMFTEDVDALKKWFVKWFGS